MPLERIRFSNREDEATGVVQLARRTRVDALPHGLYVVRDEDLALLDDLGIGYHRVADGEATDAAQRVHDPLAAPVQ